MAKKQSSFFLAVLFIANPFVLIFYQNCSVTPTSIAQSSETVPHGTKKPASEPKAQSFKNSAK